MAASFVSKRFCRKLDLTAYAVAYKDHVRQYKEALKKAKTDHYSTVISNARETQELFSPHSNLSPLANNV